MLAWLIYHLTLRANRSSIRAAVKKGGSVVYAPGFNGPLMTVDQFHAWRKGFDNEHLVYYSHDAINVNYVFIFINPADMWWQWKRFKKSLQANQDGLIVHNLEAEAELSRSLTHKFRLRLDDETN